MLHKIFLLPIGLGLVCGCQPLADAFNDKMDTFSPRPVIENKGVYDAASAMTQIKSDLSACASETDVAKRVALRDKVLDEELMLIDVNFSEYERELMRGRATTDLMLEIANLLFSGSATVVGGEETKTVLSGLATAVSGAKLAVDENLYFKQTAPALASQMRADRATLRNAISEHRNNARKAQTMDANWNAYSLSDVQYDLTSYYSAGTVFGAVGSISKDAQKKEAAATQSAENTRSAATQSAPATPR